MAETHRVIRLCSAPAVLGLGLFIANVAYVFRFTVDDAYITLRYSRNFADGIGAVYNATGARAEGYTSFLWMAVLAIPHVLHVDALVVAKALGVAFTVATCGLVFVWASSESEGSAARVFAGATAVAMYAALPRTAIHAVSGMETAPFAFLLTAALFAATRLVRDGPAWSMRFFVAATAAALTRPEASFGIGAAAATALALLPPVARRRALRTWVPAFLGLLLSYELWRIHYYGLPAPLPFYVKLSSAGALPGAEPVDTWLQSELRFALPLSVAVMGLPRHLRPPIAAVLVLTVFFLFPQHLMGYDSRYLSPLDPVVCALCGIGLGRLFELGGVSSERPEPSRTLAVAALAALPVALSASEAPAALRQRLDYADGLASAHEALGRDLAALRPANLRLALSDAGAIPYLSGLWTLDLLGLNDAHIAVAGRCDPQWVLGQSLDVVVLVSTDSERFVADDWNAYERPVFEKLMAAGFAKVDVRSFASDYWLWVLARPGLAPFRTVREPPEPS